MFSSLISNVAAACSSQTFLGLLPWYHYLELEEKAGSCGVVNFNILPSDKGPSDIPLVLLVVVDDLLRIAGLVAVIFVVYGGILYATSQGNPDQASRAQSTILNALAGLAVAIVAIAFVSFLGNRLG